MTDDTPGEVEIALEGNREDFRPGETIRGTITLDAGTSATAKRIELSVLWYTEGKGNSDMGVVYFKAFDGNTSLREQRFDFAAPLPVLPLTYHGHLIKIHWLVRVRAILASGKQVTEECGFLVT